MGKSSPPILILFALLLLLPAAAAAQANPLEIVTPDSAYTAFVLQFRDALVHLDKGEKPLAREALQGALSDKWDGGLGDLPAFAGLLLRQADKSFKNGDPEFAAEIAATAERLAPGAVETQLALSRYNLGGGPLAPGAAAADLFRAAGLLANDPLPLYRLLGRLFVLPVALLGVFGIGFALILAGRYLVLLMHDLKDLFPAGNLAWWLSLPLAAALLLLPLSAGFSWWWLASWWFMVFFLYMKTSERVVAYVWFALLLAAPLSVQYYSVLAADRQDPVLMAAIRARNGVPAAADVPVLEETLRKNPDDLLARVTLGDLLRRQGRFNAAVEAYTPVFKDGQVGQLAYNNVAEIYYAVGDMKSAQNALLSAQNAGPPQVEIFHNLGQVYQATGEMAKMGDEYKKARELDEGRADELQQHTEGFTEGGHVHRLNRVMAAMEIPFGLIWARSLRGSAVARMVESGVWRQWWGAPAGVVFQAAAGICLLLLFLLQVLGRNWHVARRCVSCGRPICVRCHRQTKDATICSPCYNVFKGDGGVDLKVKMQKRSEVQRHRDLWSRIGMVLAVAAPGSGQLLLGFTGSGLALFLLAGLIGAGAGSKYILWPGPAAVYTGGLLLYPLALAFVYLVLMTVSVLVMRGKLDTWR